MIPGEIDFLELARTKPVFAAKVAAASMQFERRNETRILLHTEDASDFLALTLAGLLVGKSLELLHSSKYLGARSLLDSNCLYLADNEYSSISLDSLFNPQRVVSPDCLAGRTISDDSRIVFYTSGSTGEPKQNAKRFAHIESELKQLFLDFKNELTDSLVISTVPHYHFYGFLFYLLLPFTRDFSLPSERLQYQESLNAFAGNKKITLVSSPSFLKRLDTRLSVPKARWTVFSSGGLLEEDAAQKCLEVFGSEAVEIYGSTETGGIALRRQKTNPLWTPFSCLHVSAAEDNALCVSSPYFDEQVLRAGDLVRFSDNGSFELMGRADTTVKVEGKRIDLKDIDSKLLSHEDITDSHTLFYTSEKREQLVCFVVAKPGSPLATLSKNNVLQAKKNVTDYLRQYFENTLLPKKVFFLSEIPRNQMSKINRAHLLSIIKPQKKFYEYSVLEQTDSAATVEIEFPASSPFFEGHFPEFPIVPGVAQIKTVFDVSKALFSHNLYIKSAKKVKFTGFIKPDTVFILKLSFSAEEKTLSFEFQREGKKCSYGKLYMEPTNEQG